MKIKALMVPLLIFHCFSFLLLDAKTNGCSLIEDLSIGVDYGDENLMFGSVSAVFLDSDQLIYILDWRNDRIQKFDRDGHFLKSILIKKGQGPEEVSMLGSVALHPDGRISLFDRGGSKIINLNEKGKFISSFKLDYMPASIASLGENRIAVLGLKEGKIIRVFDLSLSPADFPSIKMCRWEGIPSASTAHLMAKFFWSIPTSMKYGFTWTKIL